MDLVGTSEISHFRAPYKDAMFSGYGVYEGVGDDEEGLMAMWGQNPWAQGRGVPMDGYGRGQRADGMYGYGRSGVHGYGRGGAADPAWAARAYSGLGMVVAPPPIAAGEPTVSSMDPLFTIDGGLTVATDDTATRFNGIMQTFGGTDPAFAMTLSPDTIGIVVYHGMRVDGGSPPLPADAEPGPYTPLTTLISSLIPAQGVAPLVMLVDKMMMFGSPGKRSIILTRDPQTIADNAKAGTRYFLTKDADPTLVAAAKGILAKKSIVIAPAGMFGKPLGVALLVAAIGGIVLYASQGGKKRR